MFVINLSTSVHNVTLARGSKYSNFTVTLGKTKAHHTSLKKTVLSKNGRSGALLGLKFLLFLLVYGQLGAAGVPIGPL
jgi:hypothetical protein